jgi:SAM-dependent methyltransferase
MVEDVRRYAPSVARNREPITYVLQKHVPKQGLILEIASGSGEHIVHFAQTIGKKLTFQPSDPDPDARGSIGNWARALHLKNVLPAILLDAASVPWPVTRADMVICINMIHIAPWAATIGLMRGAAGILPVGGTLFLYGPYRWGGHHTAPGNEAFDSDLRSRNPEWGVRDLEEVILLAATYGLASPVIEAMPANNLSVIFTRVN